MPASKNHALSVTKGERSNSSAASLELVLDKIRDAILLLDDEWRMTYANQTARQLSHIQPEQLNSRTIWELYPEILGTELERKYREAKQLRQERNVEAFYYPPFDMWFEIRISPIDGGLAVHYRDVSEAQKAEVARAVTAEQLNEVLEATTDCVVSLDRDYRITYMNQNAKAFLAPEGEVTGKTLWEIFPKTVYADEPHERYFRQAIEKGIAGGFEAYYPAPLDKWLRVTARPSKHGIVIFFRDITEKRSRDDELKESQSRLSAIYSGTFEYIGLLSPDGTVLEANRASLEFAGNSREEVIGLKFWETPWFRYTPGAPERLRKAIERAATGEFIRYEAPLTRPQGGVITFDFSLCPVFNEKGEVAFIVPEGRDIGDLKRTQDALIQTEKLAVVGRLASSIAHEINNPLEAVTNLLYLVQQTGELRGNAREYLTLADQELRRVSLIANQTLRFHKQPTRPQPISCADLLAPILGIYRGRLHRLRISVDTRGCANLMVVVLEGEMRQVLSNLIVNALDAMPNGGRLVIRSHEGIDWETGRDGVTIVIADTGNGIPSHTTKQIFNPFFTTKGVSGTGLGLWISSEIVKRYHGKLRVRSSQNEKHRGTVFTLFLPYETQ